jgi:hypothetical protein
MVPMVPSFLFLRGVVFAIAGLEEAKNLAGKILRLIQIRLMRILFLQKAVPMCLVRRRLIFTCDFALHDSPGEAPSGVAEIVSDDFPFHESDTFSRCS